MAFDFAAYLFDFIEKNGGIGVFKPHAFYNEAGDSLEVYWSDEPDYTEDLKGHRTDSEGCPYSTMGLHRRMDTKVPTGVNVYSIKKILEEAGFKIVPFISKKTEENNED